MIVASALRRASQRTAVLDSFTRADNALSAGNAETGQAWVARNGTFGIILNELYRPAGAGRGIVTIDSGVYDVIAQVKHGTAIAVGANSGMVLRYVDASNYWWVAQSQVAGFAQKLVAGVVVANVGWATGNAIGQILKVHLIGETCKVFANAVEVGSVTSANTANGQATDHGIQVNTPLARWDDYRVWG